MKKMTSNIFLKKYCFNAAPGYHIKDLKNRMPKFTVLRNCRIISNFFVAFILHFLNSRNTTNFNSINPKKKVIVKNNS